MNGKGDKARPVRVSNNEFRKRWNATFGPNNEPRRFWRKMFREIEERSDRAVYSKIPFLR